MIFLYHITGIVCNLPWLFAISPESVDVLPVALPDNVDVVGAVGAAGAEVARGGKGDVDLG